MENNISQYSRSLALTLTSHSVTETANGKVLNLYSDEVATDSDISTALGMVISSYPTIFQKMDDEESLMFKQTFMAAVSYSGMTRQQLRDATMNCICHKHQYTQFQISDITDYDKKVALHSYSETNGVGMSALQVGSELYWVLPNEAAEKGFKVVNKQLVRL